MVKRDDRNDVATDIHDDDDEYSYNDDYSSISNYESVMMRIAENSYTNKELLNKFMGVRPTRGHVSRSKSSSLKRSSKTTTKPRRRPSVDSNGVPYCVNVNSDDDVASEVSARSDWMLSRYPFRIDNWDQHVDSCIGLRPPRHSQRDRYIHEDSSTMCRLSSLACVVGDKKKASLDGGRKRVVIGDTSNETSFDGDGQEHDDDSGTSWF